MPQDPQDFPLIPLDLLEHLERLFPQRCPLLTQSEREMFLYAGQVKLVQFLRNKHEEQTHQSNALSLS